MPRQQKAVQGGLFHNIPGSSDSSPGYVSHYPRTCPLCNHKGMHYFHGDGTKPIESWCGHCSVWSRMIDGVWTKCQPDTKTPELPGPSGHTPGDAERETHP